jgi:DNA-binding transcriptional LysR family regulator
MDRLYLMTVFVAVAEEESFAAAGRRLGMSPPAVTRAIALLEERLGVKLLNRTTRVVRATEAGQRYLEDARRVIAAADQADEAAVGINAEPRGHMTVTAPVLFGRIYVVPGIAEYLQRYPATTLSALFLDRVVNLLEEGVDVAIRIGDLSDSSDKALKVGSVRHVLVASPAYLERMGTPTRPEDLSHHQIINASGVGTSAEWTGHRGAQARLTVSSNDAAIEAAVLGVGITRLINYQVAAQLQSGQLQLVLSEFESPRVPVHIVHREGRHASAKIRSFIDLMAERLRADPSLS